MKTKLNVAAIALLAAALTACGKPAETDLVAPMPSASTNGDMALQSDAQKVSYIMGINVGSQINADDFEFDTDAFGIGIKDALSGAEARLDEEEVKRVLDSFQAEMAAKQEAAAKIVSDSNLAEGAAFLAKKGASEGVVVLESGLQYKIIEPGTGASPSPDDTVEVHYRGTLIDGTEFDSSHKRGVPAQFGVTQVIPGWVEALQLMKEGGKWELYIPPELAYGPGGTGGAIGPNQTLIFEVELLNAAVDVAEGAP